MFDITNNIIGWWKMAKKANNNRARNNKNSMEHCANMNNMNNSNSCKNMLENNNSNSNSNSCKNNLF